MLFAKRILLHNKLAMAVLAVGVVGLCVMVLFSDPHDEPSGHHTSIFALVTPRDGATLGAAYRFTWRRAGQPAVYHFFLYEVNRTPVWSSLVKDTSLIVPSSVRLQRGLTYLWRVEAILPDEKTIHSELRAFTLSQ